MSSDSMGSDFRATSPNMPAASNGTVKVMERPGSVPSPTRQSPAAAQDTIYGPPDKKPPSSAQYPFLHPPVEPDEIGRLGNYRVLRLLGKGGMAYVFLAEDVALRRRVALKVMKPDLDADPSACQRFLREARAVASIKHKHLVTVYQVGQENRIVYLVMEWLKGETIEDWVERNGPVKVPHAIRIGREITAGLAVIHRGGLVHRDIKPGNLWLEKPRGLVKILDFGLARHVNDDANFTQSGMIVGTPAYMSPEQARGEKIDVRSDLFSLGCVLYYLCTGKRPFHADNTIALLTALAILDPAPIAKLNPRVPKALADLIMQLLAKDPAARPESAEVVFKQLCKIEAGDTVVVDPPKTDFTCFSLPDDPPPPVKRAPKKKRVRRARRWQIAVGSVVVLVVFMGIAAALIGSRKPDTAQAKDTPVSSPAPVEKKTTALAAPPAKLKSTFLSDLKPVEIKNWIKQPPLPPEPPDFDPADGPGPPAIAGVRVRGEPSLHGIFMHPPPPPNSGNPRLAYSLNRQYDVFQADVSLNDGPMRSDTPLTFYLYGDGKLLWKSREVSSQDDSQTCNVSIKNVGTLAIEIECPGEPRGAHAVWIEPRVSK